MVREATFGTLHMLQCIRCVYNEYGYQKKIILRVKNGRTYWRAIKNMDLGVVEVWIYARRDCEILAKNNAEMMHVCAEDKSPLAGVGKLGLDMRGVLSEYLKSSGRVFNTPNDQIYLTTERPLKRREKWSQYFIERSDGALHTNAGIMRLSGPLLLLLRLRLPPCYSK